MKINNNFRLCAMWDFFKNKNKIILNHVYGYYGQFIYFSLSFSFLLNIKMETNYHSNLIFIYAFKYKNWNNQIHSYLRGNQNGNKKFILIPHSRVPNTP